MGGERVNGGERLGEEPLPKGTEMETFGSFILRVRSLHLTLSFGGVNQ